MYGVGDSEAIPRDMNRFLFSSTLKNSSDAEFIKSRQLTTTNLYETQQQQHQQQQQSCALMRNRSAPSSFFAGLLDGNATEDYLNPHSSMADTETIFGGFVSSDSDSRDLLQHPTNMKHENIESVQGQKGHFHSSVPARDLPSMESSYSVVENLNKVKATSGSGNCSNLIRQSSSPAGFLSNLTAENARGVGNFRTSNKFGLEASSSTINLSNHMNFSSGPSSSSRFMPQIAENGHESIGRANTVNGHLGDVNDTSRCYLPTIPNDSWNESTFTGLKRNRDGDLKMFSSLNELDSQNGDSSHYAPGLVHHLSLPKTSVEMAAVEKYLQFEQDAVPCKIRAKRGFATHPRSIAERVRRTRISQRMRKLQELFPDMDKQANTADMLDLAVEFIKDLQKEVQILKETRAKCTCSTKHKPSPTA